MVLAIALTILLVEVIGSLVTGSVALLADAGHMLTDVSALALSLGAVALAARAPTARRTFGWQRAEILAAVLNSVFLMAVGISIIVESVQRLTSSPNVAAGSMLAFAMIAVLGNAIAAWILRAGQRNSLNIRGAYLEVLSDLLGAGVVVIASLIIRVTGFKQTDAIAGLIIGLMILPRTWTLLRDALNVLVEAVPKNIDLEVVREHLLEVAGVEDVHDLHAWTITSGMPVLSAHVVVSDKIFAQNIGGPLLDKLGNCISDHFDIEHSTFQLEQSGHQDHEGEMHL
ncbi:MAG TPA: cation diffusion facilitator family transporter [Candidatus Nanopelagicaceae bacterium]|nr:cation diffusion facilitator family transporter [Candidatus Nanopelagicaceae bacterium]